MTTNVDDRLSQGFETAAKLFANSPVMPRFEAPDEIAEDWTTFSVSTMLGDIWSRPQLDLPDRAMIAIAGLTALNRPGPLRAYILGALSLGISRAQVCEVIFQMAGYAGIPAAIDAFAVAKAAFAEVDEANSGNEN